MVKRDPSKFKSAVRFRYPAPSFWPHHIVVIIPACLVGYRSSILRGVAKFMEDSVLGTSWFAKPVY